MGNQQLREPGEPLRGLTALGPSKVGVEKAMRARDVSRPTQEAPEVHRGGDSGSSGSAPDTS
jgi:hypothetical protein